MFGTWRNLFTCGLTFGRLECDSCEEVFVGFRPVIVVLALFSVDAYACDATLNPGDSLTTAIAAANTGDVLCLNEGAYPDQRVAVVGSKFLPNTAGLTIKKAPAAVGDVVITGLLDRTETVVTGTWNGDGAKLVLEGLVIEGGQDRALMVRHNSDVTLIDTVLRNATSDFPGAGMYCIDSTVSMTGGSVDNNAETSTKGGGGVFGFGCDLAFTQTSFTGNNSATTGGAVHLTALSTATFSEATFSTNHSDAGGGAIYAAGASVSSRSGTFTSNTAAGAGGAVEVAAGTVELLDNDFDSNTAGLEGGALYVSATESTARRNLFCKNGLTNTDKKGGGVSMVSAGATHTWTNNRFVDNYTQTDGTSDGGAMWVAGGATVDVSNNLFLWNLAPDAGSAIGSDGSGTVVNFRNNTLSRQWGTAPTAEANGGSLVPDYNGYFKVGTNTVTKGANAVEEPADFLTLTNNLDCTDDDFHLKSTSLYIDAGDPDPSFNDEDGSRNDIGPYGGLQASGNLTDADGDGYFAEVDDCADDDASVNPAATEVCNGKDDDCINGADGAAAFLGINPSTLRNRMKKLGIDYGRKTKL